MKRIAIFGSTGSIGQSTLEVIRRFPDKFRVAGLSAHSNIDILARQISEFRPEFVCLGDATMVPALKAISGYRTKIFTGEAGLFALAQDRRIDEAVMAISGACALKPLLKAIDSGKDIVLANKEALAMAGPMIMRQADKRKVRIKPVDSEQSAIWQCLNGERAGKLKNIYLTASGGPFRKTGIKALKAISVNDALRHPRWKMGRKITIDSATLMNKGLELLEAMYLFGVRPEKIKILIHPEAIIHSMVEFVDGVVMAQLSITDMRIPIQYAMTYPERMPCADLAGVDFLRLGKLNFQKPDFKKFACLDLAYRVAVSGGTAPCVLNAANEVSVEAFLGQRLGFIFIPRVIERVLERHRNIVKPSLDDIFSADSWARDEARKVIDTLKN